MTNLSTLMINGPSSHDYGRRIIPKLVDEIAEANPQRPFISIPRSSSIDDGYKDISYHIFAQAVNRCSWLLEKELGRGTGSTIFYIGPLDIRHLIVILAAVKSGHVVSFLICFCGTFLANLHRKGLPQFSSK